MEPVSPLPPRADRLAALVHTRDDRVLVVDGDGRCWSGPSGLGDVIGVAGAGTRDCGLKSLNLDYVRQSDVARVIDWQSTGAAPTAAWCLGAGMVGSVAPDGRSVGLAASNGGGGIRWSVADLGTGAEGTVSLLPGSWVPGAPWLADQPLTKSAGSPGTGSTGTSSTGTGSTFQLVDGSGRVLVDSDPALQVDEVHLAQWFVDARS